MLYNVIEDTEKIKARPQNVDVFLVLWESNPRFRGGVKVDLTSLYPRITINFLPKHMLSVW